MSHHHVTILAGAMGTELQRRGYRTTLPLWSSSANLKAPELVRSVHEDYLRAGADLITTNTFRTNIRPWKKVGKADQAAESTKRAIELALQARDAANKNSRVGGSITTVEDCYQPENAPSQDELEDEHGAQVELFQDSGVDFLMLETLNALRETEVLLRASATTGLPLYVSFVTNLEGDLLSGEPLKDAVALCQKYNAAAILLNCRPPQITRTAADKLTKLYSGTRGVFANGHGAPHEDLGWTFHDNINAEEYLGHARHWAGQGFSVIGGCCGTTPEYIELLLREFKD